MHKSVNASMSFEFASSIQPSGQRSLGGTTPCLHGECWPQQVRQGAAQMPGQGAA